MLETSRYCTLNIDRIEIIAERAIAVAMCNCLGLHDVSGLVNFVECHAVSAVERWPVERITSGH